MLFNCFLQERFASTVEREQIRKHWQGVLKKLEKLT
jgi:hypothetical protein